MKAIKIKRLPCVLCCLLLALCLSACSSDKSGSYRKAIEIFATGDYAAAAEAFERLGDYQRATAYAAYSTGLVLFDQGQYDLAEPYFAQARDLLTGEQHYQFCHAYALEAAGEFEEAKKLFEELTDFEDASIHALYCSARTAEINKNYADALFGYAGAGSYGDAASRLENLQTQIYNYAVDLKDNQRQYDQALNLFSILGDYFDSQVQARECKQYFRDQLYDEAEALLASGDLQGAYDGFLGLSGYRDAAVRAEEVGQLLGIAPPEIN